MNTRNTLITLLAMFGLMLLGLLWSQGFPAYRRYVEASEQIIVDVARNDLLGALVALQRDGARIAGMGDAASSGTPSGDLLAGPVAALRRVADTLSGLRVSDIQTLGAPIGQAAGVLQGQADALAEATAAGHPPGIAAARDAALLAIRAVEDDLVAARHVLLVDAGRADPQLAGLQLVGNALLAVNHAVQLDRALLLGAVSGSAAAPPHALHQAEPLAVASYATFDVLLGTIGQFDKAAADEMAGLFGFIASTYEPVTAVFVQALDTGDGVASARDAWLESAAAFDRMVAGVRAHVFDGSQVHHAQQKSAALGDLQRSLGMSAAVFLLFSLSMFLIERLILRPIERVRYRMLDLVAGDMTQGPIDQFTLSDLDRMADAVRVFRVDALRRARMSRDQLLLHERIADAHNSLKADMRAAAKVQLTQMPEPGDVGPIHFTTFFEAAQEVAGDTFDYLQLSDDRVGLFHVDVAGHGAAAGLVSVAAHIAARRALRKLDPDGSLVGAVEALNTKWSPDLTYFTMIAIELDTRRDQGRMVQAGHPHPVLMRANGAVSRLGQGGLPIGVVPDAEFDEIVFPFLRGDRLFVFSDGIYENINDRDEFFTEDSFIDLLSENARCSTDILVGKIRTALKSWCGAAPFSDDVSLVVAERM